MSKFVNIGVAWVKKKKDGSDYLSIVLGDKNSGNKVFLRNENGEEIEIKMDKKNNMAKLTEEQVIDIRKLKGIKSQSEIAVKYNVSSSTIGLIHRNMKWKNL